MRKFLLSLLLLTFVSAKGNSQTLHIYGGSSHDDYLRGLNCNSYDPNSIWNEYGTYGNSYNADCIWNADGTYGNEYS